jgi:flagellar protein FliO/FliZ
MARIRPVQSVVFAALLAFAPALAAAAEPTPASLGADGVIYPRNSPEARQQQVESEGFPFWSMLGVIAVLAGAGFYLVKRGQLGTRAGTSVHQRLAIEETRPLGNKQFLAVAAYGERRILLAVCPGRIDYLCRLDGDAASKDAPPADPARREAFTG